MAAKKKNTKPKEIPVPEPITDLQFNDRVMRSNLPVVLLVCAPHSENSAIMEKEIRYIAASYKGKLEFFSINADKNPETFGRYGIRSLPTLLFFQNRSVVDRIVGLLLGGALKSRIERLLDKNRDEFAYRGPRNLAQWAKEHNIYGNSPYIH
jgi:thioredoxin 1